MSNVLSEDTINVLKNFATINPNLVFTPGQKVKTISEAKTIILDCSCMLALQIGQVNASCKL